MTKSKAALALKVIIILYIGLIVIGSYSASQYVLSLEHFFYFRETF